MAIIFDYIKKPEGFEGEIRKSNVIAVITHIKGDIAMNVEVSFYGEVGSSEKILPSKSYLIPIDSRGDNYKKQMYEYLITLEDFKSGRKI